MEKIKKCPECGSENLNKMRFHTACLDCGYGF